MPEKDPQVMAEAEADFHALLESAQSLILSTSGESPTPEASYAPFVRTDNGDFYVFLSDMARHTVNLRHGNAASVMIIEDESAAKQIFARRRATFTVHPTVIEPSSAEYSSQIDALRAKFGEIMQTLIQMSDFHLIRLRPTSGRVVLGFAAAYRVCGDSWDNLAQRVAASSAGHGAKSA